MIVIFRAAGRQTVGCIQPRETILKSQPGGSVGWMWPSRAVKLGGVRITAEMPPGSDGPSTTFIRNAGIELMQGVRASRPPYPRSPLELRRAHLREAGTRFLVSVAATPPCDQ